MLNIEEVAGKTYRLPVTVPGTIFDYAVYFIDEPEGAIIDPGPAATAPTIEEAMVQLGMKPPAYIIPTHIHMDHAGAAGRLAQLFPRAKVAVHPDGARHIVTPSRLIESVKMSFGDDFASYYGSILPVPEEQVVTPGDGEVISVSGRELQVIYSPGHARHHLAIFDRKTAGLFCGEALGLPKPGAELSPLPAAAPPGFDMEAYLETMEKLRALNPRLLFYSHDGVGSEPQELISRAAENTGIFGDIILKGLKSGADMEAIKHRIQEYYLAERGMDIAGADTEMTFRGFALYFKKKGLV